MQGVKEIFHPQIHSSNASNSQSWVRANPASRNPIQVSMLLQEAKYLAQHLLPPGSVLAGAGSEAEQELRPRRSDMGCGRLKGWPNSMLLNPFPLVGVLSAWICLCQARHISGLFQFAATQYCISKGRPSALFSSTHIRFPFSFFL